MSAGARMGAALLGAMLGGTACGPEAEGVPAVVVAGADTVVSPESDLLATPVDLTLDPAGRLYVLDQALARMVRLESGKAPVFLGRRGRGPGELEAPWSLRADGDTVRVDDRGNRRVAVFTSAGRPVRTFPLPPRAPGRAAFSPGGEVAVATHGLSAMGLVRVVSATGEPRGGVGVPLVRAVALWDLTVMKAEIRDGRVPAVMRNVAQPVFGDDGATWLLLPAEGAVAKYAPGGRRLWSLPVSSPEVDEIRETFFRLNQAEKNPFGFYPLEFFADAVAVRDELWVLVGMPEDRPSSVLVLGADGRPRRRLVLRDVQGARALAVDRVRNRLYLAVPSTASVLSVRLAAART